MLNNRFAGEALKKVDKLCAEGSGIEINGQIVLCKGGNDKEELHRSLSDLYNYRPNLKSVSVVPVGLSKYRDGLYPLEPFEKEDAREVIKEIEYWQEKSFEKYHDHFVHASDEWYMIAELPIPEAESYDDYGQLENGVGMVRLLLDEFDEALLDARNNGVDGKELSSYKTSVSTVSGRLIYPFICDMVDKLEKAAPDISVHCYEIRNDFFGERITVTGLLTGQDIIAQLKGKELGDTLLLPQNVLRAGEDYLLDDIHISDIERALGVKVRIIKNGGDEFIKSILGV
jgi:putative radical SAM enzyme (TIGR03279 family)